jgi:hypothetical protein
MPDSSSIGKEVKFAIREKELRDELMYNNQSLSSNIWKP